MVRVLRFFVALLAWLRSSQARREAEILYLRQQLIVLRRSAPARPKLKTIDRLIFVCLYCLFPSLIDASIVFQRPCSAGTAVAFACSGVGSRGGGSVDLPSRTAP